MEDAEDAADGLPPIGRCRGALVGFRRAEGLGFDADPAIVKVFK